LRKIRSRGLTEVSGHDDGLQGRIGRVDAFAEFFGIQAANRMFDDNELGLHLSRLRLGADKRLKRLRRNEVGGYAPFFEFDAVVETPR